MDNYGLINSNKEVKDVVLKEVDITGNICGEFVEFSRSEVYENVGQTDVEVEYVFPIPDTSVMTGFEANIGGKILKAKVESKSKALKLYNAAVSKGIPTLNLDRVDENIFKISLGRIMSSEKVTIKVTLMDQLTYENGISKLTIPTVTVPKYYINEEAVDTLEEPSINYESYLNLLVEPLTKINITSPSHNIEVEWDDENNIGKVTFYSSKENLNKDLVLELSEENEEEASGMLYNFEENDEEKAILYLRMKPDLPEDVKDIPKDYTFILDASESMSGEKFEQAKTALEMCIRNLKEGDNFDIIAFGSKLYYANEGKNMVYNNENLKKVSEWIENLEPEKEVTSDTVIFDSIKYALSGNDESYKTILLFTDDEVNNEDEILNYVRVNIKDNRIFAFAVDTNANSYFINKLAERGYGRAEFIYSNERIDDKVLRQFNRIINPQVDITSIDWGTVTVEKTYPRTIDYLYDLEPFSIFAKVSGNLDGKVTIHGKVHDEDYVRTIDLDKLDLEENANLIQKVWTRKRIESIEGKLRGERGNVAIAMRNKIIELSKESGIISRETSFVMNEVIEEPVLGMPITNLIPINISDETLEDISEGYLLESPTLMYRGYKKDALNIKRDGILRILSKNQNADGSFSDESKDELKDKMETTVACVIAFTLGKENVINYVNQISKAVKFVIRGLKENKEIFDDRLYLLTVISLKSVLKKKVLKDRDEDFIKSVIDETYEYLKENNEKTLNVLTKIEKMSLKQVLMAVLDVTEYEEKFKNIIKDKNPKECISDYAKLAMIEAVK